MATEAAQTDTQLPTDATLTGIHVAASSSDDAALPLRGSVIHYSRTRNRFKIVPEGKMPHEAVFLSLTNMNSVCGGGRAVDDTIISQSHALLAKYYNQGKICPLCVIRATKAGICSCRDRCPSPVKRDYFKDDIDIFTVTLTPTDLFKSVGLRYAAQISSSSEAESCSDEDDDTGHDGKNGQSVIKYRKRELTDLRQSPPKDQKEDECRATASLPRPTGRDVPGATAAHQLTSPVKALQLKSTIMVQNLSAKTDRQDLISMFQCCGTVNKVYFYINQHGERSGSALVEFSTPAGAEAALKSSGNICMGEPVQISPSNITILAMEQLDHDVRVQNIDPNNCLVAYVSNLPPNTREHDILDLFCSCGSIISAKIIRPTLPTPAPPFAKVTFSSSISCKAAFELDGKLLNGFPLTVDYVPPAHCSVSPPPLRPAAPTHTGDHDEQNSMGFQWLEGLPGTPLCPKSKEHKDCTVEFTQYLLEPADDVSRQGRFVSRAKVNGNAYTKSVYFMGFRWEGREVRIGDVVLLEADSAEWIARVEKCWEERTNVSKPQNNRRLVSLMWYYHKKDLLSDLASCKKKLDSVSKHNMKQVWDDGNELLFSDHLEQELEIGSITGINVTIVGSEAEYHDLSRLTGPQKSRVFLHRFTYENRSRVVARFPAKGLAVTVAKIAQNEEKIDARIQSLAKKRGLDDIQLHMERGNGKSRKDLMAPGSAGGKAAGTKQPIVISVDDDALDDDQPLKKKRAPSSCEQRGMSFDQIFNPSITLKPYRFENWTAVKSRLLAHISKLDGLTNSPRDRQILVQLDGDIGSLMSAIDERMPSYKDLQQTQVHVTLRQFYKKHPGNNNSNLARSIWTRWRNEFDRQHKLNAPAATGNTQAANAPAAAHHSAAGSTSGTFAQHYGAPVPRETPDALRTGMKARLLMVFKEQIAVWTPEIKAGLKSDRCSAVSDEIERGVYVEYKGAGDHYKRHIESLLSCIGNKKSEFALHLLQGCIDISTVISAAALKNGFMEAHRAGSFVSKRLRQATSALPQLPKFGSAADIEESVTAESHAGVREGRSRIMAALSEEGGSQARRTVNESDDGGCDGWTLKDESFDYGI